MTEFSWFPAPVQVISKLFACILPIAHIAIGAVYMHDCPRQPYIPIYLIVSGVFGVLLAVFLCLPATSLSRVCTYWNSLMSIFLFCWFIAGNVWIYSIYQPNYDKNTTSVDPYCDKTLYLFSFWITTLVYIFLGLAVTIGCMYACICGLSLETSSTTFTTTTSFTVTQVNAKGETLVSEVRTTQVEKANLGV